MRPLRLTKSGRLRVPESNLQASIIQLAWLHGWLPIRLQVGLFRSLDGKRTIPIGEKGMPDLLVIPLERVPIGCPRNVWLECKALDGVLSAEQRAWHAWLRSNGEMVYVTRTLEDAARALGINVARHSE